VRMSQLNISARAYHRETCAHDCGSARFALLRCTFAAFLANSENVAEDFPILLVIGAYGKDDQVYLA
jgi:hypothetical protein